MRFWAGAFTCLKKGPMIPGATMSLYHPISRFGVRQQGHRSQQSGSARAAIPPTVITVSKVPAAIFPVPGEWYALIGLRWASFISMT